MEGERDVHRTPCSQSNFTHIFETHEVQDEKGSRVGVSRQGDGTIDHLLRLDNTILSDNLDGLEILAVFALGQKHTAKRPSAESSVHGIIKQRVRRPVPRLQHLQAVVETEAARNESQ